VGGEEGGEGRGREERRGKGPGHQKYLGLELPLLITYCVVVNGRQLDVVSEICEWTEKKKQHSTVFKLAPFVAQLTIITVTTGYRTSV